MSLTREEIVRRLRLPPEATRAQIIRAVATVTAKAHAASLRYLKDK